MMLSFSSQSFLVYRKEFPQCWSIQYEPPQDKTNKMARAPSEDSDQLGIRPVWSESSLPHEESLGP